MVIHTLASCSQCRTHYALMPDPNFPGQWLFFDRSKGLEQPTHIAVGGMLCLQGHILDVDSQEAAQTADGMWLNLTSEYAEAVLN